MTQEERRGKLFLATARQASIGILKGWLETFVCSFLTLQPNDCYYCYFYLLLHCRMPG